MNKRKIANDILPGDVFHPGVFLKDELKARGISQKDFAAMILVKPNVLSELIRGKRNFTTDLSIRIEQALQIDAEFWMRLQVRYEINRMRARIKADIHQSKLNEQQKKAMLEAVMQ